jgi:hypothetical protein
MQTPKGAWTVATMLFLYMLVNFADYVEETLTYYRLPAGAPQAHEIDQHAGAVEPGDQTPHACRADLPQPGELPAAGAGPGGRDA